jgi:hypothetical protein
MPIVIVGLTEKMNELYRVIYMSPGDTVVIGWLVASIAIYYQTVISLIGRTFVGRNFAQEYPLPKP